MKRAVVVYLENKKNLLTQFYCLYTSLKNISSQDTDLVVFCEKNLIDKLPNDCIKIECSPASKDKFWNNYHYINSIECLTRDNSYFLTGYDLIIRSDVDVFLTYAWNNYYPNLYSCGRGGYVNDDYTKEKIVNIANRMGLRHKHIFNVGSTHYGNATLVREVSKLSMEVAKYIFKYEFLGDEGKWPSWYKGVTTMYASEIAVNHLVEELIIDENKLDYSSAHEDFIKEHPHIHCWHTDKRFSKFMFESEKYDNIDINSLDINKVCDYCTYIALKSKY